MWCNRGVNLFFVRRKVVAALRETVYLCSIAVQLKEAFAYSEVKRGKSQPWLRNFFESPFTNSEFQRSICKPKFRKNFEAYLGDAYGYHLSGVPVFNCAEEKTLHISGLLDPLKSSLRQKYF